MPIEGSFSCDLLAAQAKEAGLFPAEAQTETTKPKAGAIFLSRRTSNDCTHTGIVARAGAAAVETIEGNTNDEGSREGYEVCARTRGYTSRDFITV